MEIKYSDYLQRKENELIYLNSHLQKSIKIDKIEKIIDILNYKTQIKIKIYNEFLTRHNLFSSETFNELLYNSEIDDLFFDKNKYTYQRYDMFFKKIDFAQKVYRINKVSCSSIGFFTTCGMASINAVFMVLNTIYTENFIIGISKNIYFETKFLLENFYKKFKINYLEENCKNIDVLYLDSMNYISIYEYLNIISFEQIKIIIVDTTCYQLNDEVFAFLIQKIGIFDIPLVFVRSHIKLDSLALEYGRLGSLNFVISNFNNSKSLLFIKTNYEIFKKIIAKTGINFMMQNIPPFLFCANFLEINTERISKIKNANEYVLNMLLNKFNDERVIYTKHHSNLFFIVNIKNKNKLELKNFVDNIIVILRDDTSDCMICHLGGFGFDLIAIDFFVINNEQTLRISIADYSLPQLKIFVNVFVNELKKFLNK